MAVSTTVAGAGILTRTTNLPLITAFTVMGWFRVDVDINNWGGFVTVGESGPTFDYYYMGVGADGTTFTAFQGATASGPALTVGRWYHAAMTVAGTGANQFLTYVNAVVATTQAGQSAVAQQSIILGASGDGNQGTNSMSAIKVYSAVLTATEIAREMQFIAPVRWSNLSSWNPIIYPVTLTYGTDLSGRENHFVGSGTLSYADNPPVAWTPFRPRLVAGKLTAQLYRRLAIAGVG